MIQDDFTIDYLNLRIHHSSGASVYTANQLYSWLMNEFDELDQMDDTVPMSAATPTAYSLINGWFLDYGDGSEAHKYLKGGALESVGWNNVILKLLLESGGYVNCVSGDRGKMVTDDASDVGNLMAYDNTNRIWWIRDTETHGQIGDTSTMDIPTGDGSGTADENSETGENLWTNLYVLGTLEDAPTLYITRDDARISGWWAAGFIDVIMLIKEAGVELGDKLAGGDTGWVQVLDRQWTDLWDWFEVDLGPGGRQAVPLATFEDLNNTTGEGTVAGWSDVVISTAGPYSKDIGDGGGVQNYDYSINCGTRILSQVYERLKYVTRDGETALIDGIEGQQYVTVAGEEGTYAPVKQAPFGTFAGGIFFGARGIWIENMDGNDTENYQLIDSAGVTRSPPTQAPITVGSVVAGDRVIVALSTGEGLTVIKKDQYTVLGTILTGSNYIDITTSIPADTPASGFIRLVDVGVSEERYQYSGWKDATFGLIENTSKEYVNPDTCYVPYIDHEAIGASIVQGLIYGENRWLVARVRKYGILPFESTAQLVSGGVTITAIRTTDTIAE